MRFFRNRIALALLGLIVFGALGAVATTMPRAHTSVLVTSSPPPALSNVATQPAQATPTTSDATLLPTPTAVILHATVTPSLTKTPPSPTVLRGTIGAITTTNGGSFILQVNAGGTMTVVVASNTRYQGVNNFNDLRNGMSANVTGSLTSANSFLATTVQIQTDN